MAWESPLKLRKKLRSLGRKVKDHILGPEPEPEIVAPQPFVPRVVEPLPEQEPTPSGAPAKVPEEPAKLPAAKAAPVKEETPVQLELDTGKKEPAAEKEPVEKKPAAEKEPAVEKKPAAKKPATKKPAA
ncbi:MAG: hypothetical protein HN348_28320, partial [Proteobacteria bacterium]|nr:hypothetical protein [Pseudomonadota bacterium]